jgi:ubiquinone/menaquinone biosynthesis C-methylase UbiE
MDSSFEATYHQHEEAQWWFVTRREMILEMVKRLDLPAGAQVLEVGCSGGVLLEKLQKGVLKDGVIHGIDISTNAISLCRDRGLERVAVMDGSATTFSDRQFDLIIASDTLEHIAQDKTALAEWHRILKPSGSLIIFVPAHPFLWSHHDEVNHHHRRYRGPHFRQLIQNAGFDVKRYSFWNFTLFFAVMTIRLFQRLTRTHKPNRQKTVAVVPGLMNRLLMVLLRIENKLLNRYNIDFPVGISLFALCQKIRTGCIGSTVGSTNQPIEQA